MGDTCPVYEGSYCQRNFDPGYKEKLRKADESYNKLVNNKYKLGEEKFLEDLRNFSFKTPKDKKVVISAYFGFYLLPKEEQKKYTKTIKDKDGYEFTGLLIDEFDPKGYAQLKNKPEYTLGMLKSNIFSYESAKKHFQENGLKSGEFILTNKIVQNNFVSQDKVPIKEVNNSIVIKGIGYNAYKANPEGMDITLRNAGIKSYIVVNVSKENKEGEKFVTITRYTRIGDEFKEPLNVVFGLPDRTEYGNKYKMLTNYDPHKILDKARYVVKNKDDNTIMKEILNTINYKINEEFSNIKKIDDKEYKDFVKQWKQKIK